MGWHEFHPERVYPSRVSKHSSSKEWVWVRRRLVFIRRVGVQENLIWYEVSSQRGNILSPKAYPSHHYLANFLSKACTKWFTSTYIALTPQENIPKLDSPLLYIYCGHKFNLLYFYSIISQTITNSNGNSSLAKIFTTSPLGNSLNPSILFVDTQTLGYCHWSRSQKNHQNCGSVCRCQGVVSLEM